MFHWNWDVSLASEKTIPTVFDFYQISWKETSIQSGFQIFYRFQFCRSSLAENFVTYLLPVISLQQILGKSFLLRYFLEEVSLQSLFGRELLFSDFRSGFLCKRILGSDFSSSIFSTHFLFRVFVWIMCFFQVLFVRDFFWEFICRSFLVKISLDMVLVNCFFKHLFRRFFPDIFVGRGFFGTLFCRDFPWGSLW